MALSHSTLYGRDDAGRIHLAPNPLFLGVPSYNRGFANAFIHAITCGACFTYTSRVDGLSYHIGMRHNGFIPTQCGGALWDFTVNLAAYVPKDILFPLDTIHNRDQFCGGIKVWKTRFPSKKLADEFVDMFQWSLATFVKDMFYRKEVFEIHWAMRFLPSAEVIQEGRDVLLFINVTQFRDGLNTEYMDDYTTIASRHRGTQAAPDYEENVLHRAYRLWINQLSPDTQVAVRKYTTHHFGGSLCVLGWIKPYDPCENVTKLSLLDIMDRVCNISDVIITSDTTNGQHTHAYIQYLRRRKRYLKNRGVYLVSPEYLATNPNASHHVIDGLILSAVPPKPNPYMNGKVYRRIERKLEWIFNQ